MIVERHRPIVLRHHFAVVGRDDEEIRLVPPVARRRGSRATRVCASTSPFAGPCGGAVRPWAPRGPPAPASLPDPPAHGAGRAAGRPRTCFPRSCSSSAGPPATTPSARCVRDGVRLTDGAERAAIRAIAERRSSPSATTTCASSGTTSGWRGSSGGGRAPCRPGPGLPGDGGGVLRSGAAQGRLRHRDVVARDQHARPDGRDRALHEVRRGGAGHAHLG